MPREQITIEDFSAGIITTVDAQDTPINASSWSLDQDPEAPQGVLRGREQDEAYIDDGESHHASRHTWLTREDGKRDLLFYSKDSGKISSIADFFGTKTFATAATLSTSLITSLETFNRGARLGYGNNDVKYYGYIDHGQYGGSAPSGLQYLNSKLSAPTIMPRYHKVASIGGTYGYGIEENGQFIYKVTMATGEFSIGKTKFQKLKGICFDGTYLYVFDEGASTYGTLYLIDLTSLGISGTYPLNGWSAPASALNGCSVTDIEMDNGSSFIFFAVRRSDGHITTSYYGALYGGVPIWRYQRSSLVSGTTFYPSVHFFNTTDGSGTPVRFRFNWTVTSFFYVPKRPFVRLTNTHQTNQIGVLLNIEMPMYRDSPPTAYTAPGSVLWLSSTSLASGATDYIVSTYSNMIGLKTGAGTSLGTPDGGVWCTGITASSSQFYDVLSVAVGTTVYNFSSQYDIVPGTYTLYSAITNTPYDDDIRMVIDANSIWYSHNADTESSSKSDSIGESCMSFRGTNSTDYEWYMFLSGSSGHAREIIISCNSVATIFNSPSAVKRSPIYFTLESVSYLAASTEFDTAKRYFYRFAIIYQDYQQSPIFQPTVAYSIVPSNANYAILISGSIKTSELNSRATGIAVYRAEVLRTDTSVTEPTSEYRLVDVVSLRDAMAGDGSTFFPENKTFLLYDLGTYGQSYEAETGIPESLPNNYMRYSIGCQGNGYLFVGQCANEEFDDNSISNIIFRSKKNAPDTFDWSNDFLVLPTRPQAMHFFKNMLFVFDVNTTYVIDPESFSLLQVLDGYGCADNNHVVSNNEMMVFANANNVYLYTGQNIAIISQAVNISQYSTVGGLTVYTHRGLMASGYDLSIAFFSKKNSIALCYGKTATTTKFLVFHIPTKSWHYWEIGGQGVDYSPSGGTSKHVFSDYLGNCYLSADLGIGSISTSATRNSCTWISRQFNGGDVTILKKFVRIILNTPYGGTITTKYYALNANTTINTAFTSGVNLNDLASKANNLWVKIVVGATEQLQGITIIFRRMIGLR